MKRRICALLALVMLTLVTSGSAFSGQDVELLVAHGDSLINICKEYLDDPNDWKEVAEVNAIKHPDWIYPGQRFTIPADLLRGIPALGTVTLVQGTVEFQAVPGGKWGVLQVRSMVTEDTQVRTGPESTLEITFEDGSAILLRSDTTLGFSKLRKRGTGNLIQEFFLRGGRIINRIKKSTGGQPRFRIRTPSATAAARGTDFRVSLDRRDDTRVEVLGGTVSAQARQRKVLLSPGEGALIRKGREVSAPRKLLDAPALMDLEPLYRRMPMELRFTAVAGAAAYRVTLARNQDFKVLVKESLTMPMEVLKIDSLEDGSYYLQVASIDELGLEGLPSEPVPIKVRVNPLPPFVQFPMDNTEYKTVSMMFQWLKVEDADNYHLQMAEDADFTRLLIDAAGLKDMEFKKSGLEPKTYYFRIRSNAADGYLGIWSDTQRFTLLQPPPQPTAEPPKMSRKQIHIRWKDLGEGFTYHFQMSRDKEFSELSQDVQVSEPQIILEKPKKAGTYYVRVSSINAEGFEGNFSAPQSFKIKRFPWEALGMGATIITFVIIGVL
jgi:hypothetical protein